MRPPPRVPTESGIAAETAPTTENVAVPPTIPMNRRRGCAVLESFEVFCSCSIGMQRISVRLSPDGGELGWGAMGLLLLQKQKAGRATLNLSFRRYADEASGIGP